MIMIEYEPMIHEYYINSYEKADVSSIYEYLKNHQMDYTVTPGSSSGIFCIRIACSAFDMRAMYDWYKGAKRRSRNHIAFY